MPKGARVPAPGGAARPASLRGLFYVSTPRGNLRITAWPKPRGSRRHQTNKFWTAWLVAATYLYRYQPAQIQAELQRATAGTVYMPRDVFISAMRARAFALRDENGRKYYPMSMREDVSDSLDSIAQLEGQLMYRGPELWTPVPIGTDGQHLVLASGVPAWADDSAGGASYAFIPIYRFQTLTRTTNVNSLTYVTRPELEFGFDCDELPFTAFRIRSHAHATALGQTVTIQLATSAAPGTPLSATGDDEEITLDLTPRDTGWIDVPTPLSGFQNLTLALKGSNSTVDLAYTYLELHLKA